MTGQLFTADHAWSGGFYELALEFGPPSDDRLRAALATLWRHPDFEGCYLDRDREPDDQPRMPPDKIEYGSHLYGVARLPNGLRVACGSCPIREMDDGPNWLDFYLPMDSLATAYPAGAFPFGTEADWPGPWRYEVEDWLAEVGLSVARAAKFELGTIGFEVAGEASAADVNAQGMPTKRLIGYLWPAGDAVDYLRRSAD